jgi:hypothetical protein
MHNRLKSKNLASIYTINNLYASDSSVIAICTQDGLLRTSG